MHDTSVHDTDDGRLLEYLRERDVPCPLCKYNLRDLTQPQCPECHHDLKLTVGAVNPQFLWFIVALAPCIFATIAAVLLLIPMGMQMVFGQTPPPLPMWALDGTGWLSAVAGVILIRDRFRFLGMPLQRQRTVAAIVWFLHFMLFFGWMAIMLIVSGGP
ncbi:MAG: hypothetical protein AAF432_01810 [Planctomycetota bacterium]